MQVRKSSRDGVQMHRNAWVTCCRSIMLAIGASMVPLASALAQNSMDEAPAVPVVGAASLPRDLSPWGMFISADIIVKAVIIGLALASVVTWTVWLAKTIELAVARRRTRASLAALAAALSLSDDRLQNMPAPAAQLMSAASTEIHLSAGAVDKGGLKERVASRLGRIEAACTRRIHRGTGVLATVGATAPFVGLFGTVWGIYHALLSIAMAGTISIDKIAGPVGEALLMTAFGLAVAIPAVLAYNAFTRVNRLFLALLDGFAHDLHAFVTTGARLESAA